MGQALRRVTGATGRAVQTPSSVTEPIVKSSRQSTIKIIKKPKPREVPPEYKIVSNIFPKKSESAVLSSDDTTSENNSRVDADTVLEQRDQGYDAMLSKMVGRIKTKPGGKLEMGEASIVERYSRPLPKLRTTKPDSTSYEDTQVPPGTLNVSQLKQILLMHKDEFGATDIHQIAENFKVNTVQIEKIVQFLSLPQEEETTTKQKD